MSKDAKDDLTKIWELALGIIMVAVSLPLLLVSILLASIVPGAGLIVIVALFLVALGIGLMHDSTYQSEPKTSQVRQPTMQQPTISRVSNYCSTCGAKLDKGAAFCASCGVNVLSSS